MNKKAMLMFTPPKEIDSQVSYNIPSGSKSRWFAIHYIRGASSQTVMMICWQKCSVIMLTPLPPTMLGTNLHLM